MWINIFIGSLMILITTILHSGATLIVINYAVKHSNSELMHRKFLRPVWLGVIVLFMFFSTILESSIWTFSFIYLGAIQSFEEALYFSIVTFSTLGYGDIVLDQKWRLLGAIEATNGIIIFGWSTAIVMAAVQKIYISNK